MKFLSVLLATAALSSASAELIQRDVAAIQSAISSIGSAAAALTSQVNGIGSTITSQQEISLVDASQALISDINAGTAGAGTTPLTTDQAVQLAIPIQGLTSSSQGAIQGLINKKAVFVAAGLGGAVETQLQQVQTAALAFQKAVVALVPASLQGTASSLTQPLDAALQSGVAAFAGTGSSGPAPASSSAPAPAQSSAPAPAKSSAVAPASSSPMGMSSPAASQPAMASSPAASVPAMESSPAAGMCTCPGSAPSEPAMTIPAMSEPTSSSPGTSPTILTGTAPKSGSIAMTGSMGLAAAVFAIVVAAL